MTNPLRAWRRWLPTRRQPAGKRFPIAILSFDRPHYLRQVLESLRPQVDENDRIILFQDGNWNPYSKKAKTTSAHIAVCIGMFREAIPWGEVRASDVNLGIAWNYERAERLFFDAWREPSALFLEDDLVLGPHYLDVIAMLLGLAEVEPRIGYVTAYGNFWATLEQQRQRPRDLTVMRHLWGYATTRRAWLAERPFRERYLQLVTGIDYARRDHDLIFEFYRDRGWKVQHSSQDRARDVASVELGRVHITTYPCHARYIGAIGLHATQDHYDKMKYGETVVCPDEPVAPLPPTEDQIAEWLAEKKAAFALQTPQGKPAP